MGYQFNFNQDHLSSLCEDRPLATSEIHIPNDYYGQATILKQYAGLPNSYPLKVVLEHGLFFDDWMWDVDQHAQLPIFLSSSEHRSLIHRKTSSKPSIPVGFGFLYAVELYQKKYGKSLSQTERRGTVVFPSHSTHYIKAVFDFEDYANKLKSLPEEFQPITICIYWKDFLHGYHKFYQKSGFKVVTAGHMYDPLFLYRFFDICRQFKYSTSNNIGTHLFLSVRSGCSFFYTSSHEITHEADANVHIGGFTPMFSQIKNQSLELFASPKDKMCPKQLKFVDKYLGTEYIKKPNELKQLLLYAELRDKLWPTANSAVYNEKKELLTFAISLPSFWQRLLTRNFFKKVYKALKLGSKKLSIKREF